MTPAEVRGVAEQAGAAAGRAAARDIFVMLGLDVNNPIKAQRDFAALHNFASLARQIQTKGILVAIGVLVTGGLGLVWAGLKAKLGG